MKTVIFISLCFFLCDSVWAQNSVKIPRIDGEYIHIYKPKGDKFPGPNTTELKQGQYYKKWVPNDHCFVKSDDGIWHLFGITHPLTSINAVHEGEFMSLHAVAPKGTLGQTIKTRAWKDKAKILTPEKRPGDIHEFYAPTHVKKDGINYLIWGPSAPLRYATSKDLYNWDYQGKLKDTPDDRDPNILFYEGTYYLITCGKYCVNIATSKDLITWTSHKPIITSKILDFESPYLVRYNNTFYLFACFWDGIWDMKSVSGAYQHITKVYQSDDIFNFDNKPITEINAHAPEIIKDEDGDWYISSAEWPNRGISVARLIWE